MFIKIKSKVLDNRIPMISNSKSNLTSNHQRLQIFNNKSCKHLMSNNNKKLNLIKRMTITRISRKMVKEDNKISILMRLIKLIEKKNNFKPKSLSNHQHNK